MSLCTFTPGVIGASCLNGTIASIVTSTNVTIETKLDKRDCVCCGAHSGTDSYVNADVTAGGVWWAPWKKASGCYYAGNSQGSSTFSMEWSSSESKEYSSGVSVSVGGAWKSILNANVGYNHGWTFGTSSTKGGSYACTVPAGSVGQMWSQQAMGWSDGRYRTCTRKYVCGAITSDTCGAWSASIHQDWVLQDANNVNLGCSTGYDKVSC
ncbi:hypothetical protein BJ742DRAFT_853354 [Cladochytrium replicatum]|nr:hypothetical protein BJ742DRAFT_853351 [Cladochytrium replicatum]KAI8808555.1 hypothetical protein BJ742DRAFT_853354 [Cladochytrium replicatum]